MRWFIVVLMFFITESRSAVLLDDILTQVSGRSLSSRQLIELRDAKIGPQGTSIIYNFYAGGRAQTVFTIMLTGVLIENFGRPDAVMGEEYGAILAAVVANGENTLEKLEAMLDILLGCQTRNVSSGCCCGPEEDHLDSILPLRHGNRQVSEIVAVIGEGQRIPLLCVGKQKCKKLYKYIKKSIKDSDKKHIFGKIDGVGLINTIILGMARYDVVGSKTSNSSKWLSQRNETMQDQPTDCNRTARYRLALLHPTGGNKLMLISVASKFENCKRVYIKYGLEIGENFVKYVITGVVPSHFRNATEANRILEAYKNAIDEFVKSEQCGILKEKVSERDRLLGAEF
jgi:hypothetical protein